MSFRSHRESARAASESSYAVTLATCQRAAQAGITPGALIASSQYGGSSMTDAASRERAQNAREQLGHFRGEVYTSIRPIMERLAGRPIRVARIEGQGNGKKKRKPGKAASDYVRKWLSKSSLLAGGAEPREVEIIDQHPVLDAIHDPAPSIVGWSNWHLKLVSVASLCITGYAYWWFPVVDGRVELWYLPPDWVWPLNTKEKLNVGWEIHPPHADKVEVPREAIAPFWLPDPANPLQGLGPLEAGARGVMISEFLEECQKRQFQLGPHPSALVKLRGLPTRDGKSIKPRLKQYQMNQVRDAFDMRYGNVYNAGRPIIMGDVIESVDPWGNKPHEMSYGENADSARNRVRQGFGTNDYAVGQGSLGSRAESAESDYHFVENNLNPKCELLSRTMTVCVLPVFDDDSSLIMFIEPCEPHDSEQKAADYKFAAQYGIIDIGEFRVHRLGMEPGPHGANFLVPNTYSIRTPEEMAAGIKPATPALPGAPGGALPSPQEPSEPAEPGETPEDDESPLADGEEPKSLAARKKNFDDAFRKQYIDTWLKNHGEREVSLASAMLKLQTEQADAIAAALKHLSDDALDSSAAKIAKKIFDPDAWVDKLKQSAREPLLYAWLSGASQELLAFGELADALPAPSDAAENQKAADQKDADLGYDFGVDLPDDVKDGIAAGLEKSLSQPYWSWIEDTKRNDLLAFLESGLDEGLAMPELVKHVRSVFDGEIGADRALTIARTEVTTGLNSGAWEAQKHLEDEGVLDAKQWVDTADARTRVDHLDAGGQTVGVRDKFVVGGESCNFPGDPVLSAKQRVRCRCASSGDVGFSERAFVVSTKCEAHEHRYKSGWPYRSAA